VSSSQRSSVVDVLTWLALLVALSPQFFDLAKHLTTNSWAQCSLAFPPLLLRCALMESDRHTPTRWGYLLIVIALALSLLGALGAAELIRFTRYSIPLAILGLALAQGRPSWKVAGLAFWAIPLPSFLMNISSPSLETAGLDLTCIIFGLFSAQCNVSDTTLTSSGEQLVLYPHDGGLLIVALLSGLALYVHIVQRSDLRSLSHSLIRALCFAFPLQWAAILLAAILARLNHAETARLFLSSGLWISIVGYIVIQTELKVRC